MKPLDLVLLIDDDETTNYLNKRVLDKVGVGKQIEIVSNGEDALDYLRQACDGAHQCPDLILLDIKMPVMDGFEFLEEYKNLDLAFKDRIAIIMLTSSASFYDLERLKEYPDVKKHYSKPLTEADVREMMQEFFPGHATVPDVETEL